MSEFKFKQGDRVRVYPNGREGVYPANRPPAWPEAPTSDQAWSADGKIVGCASTEMAILGRFWLVEVDPGSLIPNETYPFSVLSLPEPHITLIEG